MSCARRSIGGSLSVLLLLATAATAAAEEPRVAWPYREGGRWVAGQLHAHARQPGDDGTLEPAALARAYREAGAQFLALTSHAGVVDRRALDQPGRFVTLPGREIHFYLPDRTEQHAIVLGLPRFEPGSGPADRQPALDRAAARGGFVVLAHPSGGFLSPRYRWDDASADELEGYHALEIASGLAPRAVERWDRLLSRSLAVWGVAADDFHGGVPPMRASVAVQLPESEPLTAAAVLAALAAGRFQSSLGGLRFTRLVLEGRTLRAETDREADIRFLARGRTLAAARGRSARYPVRGDEGYLRVEAAAGEGLVAWSQPAWVDPPGRIRVAAVQMAVRRYRSWDDFRDHLAALMERAARGRPDLVAFPEHVGLALLLAGAPDAVWQAPTLRAALARWAFPNALAVAKEKSGSLERRGLAALARRAEGHYRAAFSELARRHRVTLVAGTALLAEGERLANACLVFGPGGEELLVARKVNLTALEAAGGLGLDPGKLSDLGVTGGLGVSICLDSFFAAPLDRLRAAGARLLVDPKANPKPWTEAERRANATGLLAYLARHGLSGVQPFLVGDLFELSFRGQSAIYEGGTIVALARSSEREAVIFATLRAPR